MTSIPYYPGCTLNTVAKPFDLSARRSLKVLGIELAELSQWNCCGASFPLTPNNVIGLAGPTNVLIQSKKAGGTVSTLCSFCYNTLRRTNQVVQQDEERRTILNGLLGSSYEGDVEVVHLLEVLRDRLGFTELKKRVSRNLKKLKVGAYYGCTLLRPKAVAIDGGETTRIFEEFLDAIGCDAIEFPNRGECCGSHLAMSNQEIVTRLSGAVLASAQAFGAEVVTTTCPLCFYNLERSQKAVREADGAAATVPVLYFTQLLGLALGLPEEELGMGENLIDPRPALEAKGIVEKPLCVMRHA
jgi:heterodisulfide reductase subunit B